MNKIIAVDFDGTLTIGDCWPEIGKPNWPVINYILKKKSEGAKIILWTCRTDKPLEYAIEWCQEHGIIFDAVNENLPEAFEWLDGRYPESRKIYADEYIDDKAINSEHSDLLYFDNMPAMLVPQQGGREVFKTRIFGILRDYFPLSYAEGKLIAERIIRELWEM